MKPDVLPASMIYHEIRAKNLRLSRIGLGTVNFGMDYAGIPQLSPAEAGRLLAYCRTEGINFLDTAPAYGTSEEILGRYQKANPAPPFFIATKLQKITAEQAAAHLPEIISRSVDHSCARLQVPALDLLQLHQTEPFLLQNPALWQQIKSLKAQRRIRGFGVSVYEPEEARWLMQEVPGQVDFIQIPLNLFDQRFLELIPPLHRAGIAIIARSVFLRGIIPCEIAQLPPDLQGLKPVKLKLSGIAQSAGLSPAGLALAFVLSLPEVATAILGARSPEEIEQGIHVIKKINAVKALQKEIHSLAVHDPALIDPRRWDQP